MPKLRMLTSTRVLACMVIAGLLLLAACGDDDDGDSDGTPAPEASEDATATPSASDDATPGPSGTPADTGAPIQLSEFTIDPSVTRAEHGTVTFTVTNAGEFPHEFVVIRSDLPIAQLPRLGGEEGVDEDELDIVDRLEPIDPGSTGVLVTELENGKYVLICNLVGGGESHYLNGMYEQFSVEDLPGQPSVVTPVPLQ